MSKRIDKKKQKRQTGSSATSSSNTEANAIPTSASAVPVSIVNEVSAAEQIDFFIQYQDQEYLEKDIIEKIKKKCKEEGKEVSAAEKLSVYLKPEDKKAYFTYAGFSSFIEL